MKGTRTPPTHGEHHGEHVERYAQRAEAYPRVEIHVGVQLAFDEVLVRQRHSLQLRGVRSERYTVQGVRRGSGFMTIRRPPLWKANFGGVQGDQLSRFKKRNGENKPTSKGLMKPSLAGG